MAASSSAVAVQPVGLFGEFRMKARAPGSMAANRSKSSRNRPSVPASSGSTSTVAPRSSTALAGLGQAGVCSTTRSPARTVLCSATLTAVMPDPVTWMRPSSTGFLCSIVRCAANASRSAGIPRTSV